jgi:hypothetical protein
MSFKDLVLEYRDKIGTNKNIFRETDEYFLKEYFKNDKKFLPQPISIIPGKIYYFNYSTDSKITKERKFIDRFPVILCTDFFETGGFKIMKGIDLVTTPMKYRMEIISRIFDSFEQTIKDNGISESEGGIASPLNLKDSELNKILGDTGYKSSLFGFKTSFIKNAGSIIYKDWSKLPYLTVNLVEGLNISGIYSEYESKLK